MRPLGVFSTETFGVPCVATYLNVSRPCGGTHHERTRSFSSIRKQRYTPGLLRPDLTRDDTRDAYGVCSPSSRVLPQNILRFLTSIRCTMYMCMWKTIHSRRSCVEQQSVDRGRLSTPAIPYRPRTHRRLQKALLLRLRPSLFHVVEFF